ncbi:hypothetical protein L1049_012386 [Liquidambar formosana]|uniref:Small auxin up regulated protein n=1 Tax=Liquidambar formosana TaxID=63359 RepID=A0AAP0N150_LIQFO
MGILFPKVVNAKKTLQRIFSSPESIDVLKGHFDVYIGEIQKKQFVVPISYLKHPSFQNLLSQVEEEFGSDHPMGGLTILCREEAFIDFTCSLYDSKETIRKMRKWLAQRT